MENAAIQDKRMYNIIRVWQNKSKTVQQEKNVKMNLKTVGSSRMRRNVLSVA